jgi:beta-glucosidase
MAPYYPALRAGVMTVMVSFNSWKGDKCHGHHHLLTEVLKQKLNFNGYIISDWDGIDYLSESYSEAIAMSVNAGIDMFMVSENWRSFIDHLRWHVEHGNVSIARIDDAVRRILNVKFAYGLFEKPRPAARPWSNDPGFGGAAHREVACEAVRKSLVLLKNEAQLLPLQAQARVLVAGKNAHNRGHQCGGFTVAWQGATDNDTIIGGTSIWEGIQSMAPGATLDIDGTSADRDAHDVAIVVIGETPYAEGMGDIRDGDDVIVQAGSQIKGLLKVLEPYGSSLTLNQLHPEDLQAITNITRQGVPVVVVLISGRPLLIEAELDAATAFVAAWLPGSEGQGIAQVLFGDHDFTGKLSFTWPETEGRTLFPLGYGLAY